MSKKNVYTTLLVLLAFLALLTYVGYVIFQQGIIYQRDVTDGLNLSNLVQRYFFTYSNDTSEALTLAEKSRLPLFSIIFGVFKLSTLVYNSADNYVKVKILLLYVASFFAFFIYTYKLLKLIFEDKNHSKLLLSSAAGAFFFVLNYWFTNRITHFGLFFTTALIPIAFYYLYKFFLTETGQFRDLVKLSCFLFFFSATPHAVLIFAVLFITLFFTAAILKPKQTFKKYWQLLSFFVLYAALSAFWLAPFLASNSKPDAILNKAIVQTINKNALFPNSLLLKGYWLAGDSDYYAQPNKNAQKALSWIPLFVLVAALFLWRRKKVLFLPIMTLSAVSLFLATSNPITDMFYFTLMFKPPFQSFGWLLREYDKFGILIAYVYALTFALIVAKVNKKILLSLITVTYIFVLINYLYYLNFVLITNYTPVKVPDDFSAINKELSKDMDEYNVLWYPAIPSPTWSKSKEVRYIFSNLVSASPTITQSSEYINYVENLFEKEQLLSVDLGNALNLLGVKYLIVRKDFEPTGVADQINHYLTLQPSLLITKETPLLTLYTNKKYTGLVTTYSSRLVTSMGLNILKLFPPYGKNPANEYIDYTDKPSLAPRSFPATYVGEDAYFDSEISQTKSKFIYPYKYSFDKEDGNPGAWKTGSLENLTHAELDFFLPQLGLDIKQYDFANGVVIARDGWQKRNATDVGKEINLSFSLKPNVILDKNSLEYSSVSEDQKEYWNITRSDAFDVTNVTALEINLSENIGTNLIPHYKITFYNGEGFVVDTQVFYANSTNTLRAIIKLPEQAKSADFSIWTVSGTESYKYKINGLKIQDITDKVEPVKLSFKERTGCERDCILYARVFVSQIGGTLGINAGTNSFVIDTKLTDDAVEPRYKWVKLGIIANLDKYTTFELINTKGFNSVNALVAIPKEQEISATEIGSVHTPRIERMGVKQVNPTLYEVDVKNDIKAPVMLTFAKPFSTNWRFSASTEKPLLINGYINGWYITDLKAGKYYIYHRSQTFYLWGLGVSGVTLASVAIYLLVSAKVVIKSEPISKSQG